MKRFYALSAVVLFIIIGISCNKDEVINTPTDPYKAILATFGNNINPNLLENYGNQNVPTYITKNNAGNIAISNTKATLGRVLFYDKNLSINNTVSCASCHKQEFAFGDTAIASAGVEGGFTARHSMRLINVMFANEAKYFWDERAASLAIQTTSPIKDHAEMGFSGTNGRPNILQLISKLQQLDYYKELFKFVYNDTLVSETRLQECLSHFILSIQSFDTKYDAGRATVANDAQPFPNFTQQENTGKNLFLTPPVFDVNSNRIGGGLGCAGCHQAPEFDIDPNSKNNGIIGTIATTGGRDVTVTRAPTLRDLINNQGQQNGPLMHTGNLRTLQNAIGHYGNINVAPGNSNLDPRLTPNGIGQKLNLNGQEVNSVIAFMRTLSGTNVYTNKKWSNPFL